MTDRPPAGVRGALIALFSSVFVLGTSELLVVGLLDRVALEAGVSVSSAGALVTAYALGFAVGGPVVALATGGVRQRPVLVSLLACYLLVTVLVVTAPPFAVLVALRAFAGALQGAYIGRAITAAIGLVPPARAGRAVSVVAGAIAVSTSAGVPLGTLLGRAADWTVAFGAVAVLNALAMVAVAARVPDARPASSSAHGELRRALSAPVLAVLLAIAVLFAGQYAALTYLTPFLLERVGVASSMVATYLMVYGACTALGAFLGGRAADWRPRASMVVGATLTTAAIAGIVVLADSSGSVLVLLAAWGFFGFGIVPSMQNRISSLAGPAAGLAASFPAAASNAGIAVGSGVGGAGWLGRSVSGPLEVGVLACAVGAALVGATTRIGHPPATASQRVDVEGPRVPASFEPSCEPCLSPEGGRR